MTVILAVLAFLVAGTAAVRSTWSPCGLSMLSTITPIAERGRGHRYPATCAWFVLGATVGGFTLGGLVAVVGIGVHLARPSAVVAGSVALAAALVVLTSDAGLAGVRLPVHHRQVNERWLDAYRPWVYGVGFGVQIGCGLATYITTATVYLMMVLAALVGDPVVALSVGGAFGLVRGLAVLLTRRVTTSSGLLAFHRRCTALLPWADRGVIAAAGASAVALVVAVGPGAGLAVGVPVVMATVAARVLSAARGRRAAGSSPGTTVPGSPGTVRVR